MCRCDFPDYADLKKLMEERERRREENNREPKEGEEERDKDVSMEVTDITNSNCKKKQQL